MKTKIYMLFIFIALFGLSASAQNYATISMDAIGDGVDGNLLDGVLFEYKYDQASDSLWFRVTNASLSSAHQAAFGVNIMINIPGGGNTFNFWGLHNGDPFHMLLTTWVTGAPPSAYSGTIGISDAAGVNMSNYTSLSSNNIDITMDVTNLYIVLGLRRMDLIPDSAFGTSSSITVGIQAAVGSNQFWNDDIYDPSAFMTIDLSTIGITENANQLPSFRAYPVPASEMLNVEMSSWNPSDLSITIVNALGKTVKQITGVEHERLSIPIGDLASGVYSVQAHENGRIASRKIIIE